MAIGIARALVLIALAAWLQGSGISVEANTTTSNTTTISSTTSTTSFTNTTSTTNTTTTTTTSTSTTNTTTTTTASSTSTNTTSTTSTTTTSTTTTTTTEPIVIGSIYLDGRVATIFTARQLFDVEVLGHNIDQGVLSVQEEPCGLAAASVHALEGDVGNPEITASMAQMSTDKGLAIGSVYEAQRWQDLRVTRGGSYALCWCPGILGFDCASASAFIQLEIQHPGAFVVTTFEVMGPALRNPVRDDLGRELSEDPATPACPSVNETFAIEVVGLNLTELDRLRIVIPSLDCGKHGADENTEVLDWHHAKDAGATGSTGDPVSSRAWSNFIIRKVSKFRVCWCVGVVLDNGEAIEIERNSTVLTNGTNDSIIGNGSFTPGNPIVTGVRRTPWERRQLAAATTSEASNNFSADVPHDGNATSAISWSPLCQNASDFNVDLGIFAVAGPTGVLVTDDSAGTHGRRLSSTVAPRNAMKVGFNFSLTVLGQGLTTAGRIRILPLDGGPTGTEVAVCGLTLNSSSELEGPLADTPDMAGVVVNDTDSIMWHPIRLGRASDYAVCWCSGRRTDCSKASDFGTWAGYFTVIWAGAHEILDADGNELRTIPGIEFTIQIGGIELSAEDRIRIVDSSVTCGDIGADINTAALRGPLTREPGHSGISYEPGVLTGPGKLRSDRERLSWSGLRLYAGGVFKVCWCPGGGQRGSEVFGCSGYRDYYYEVGCFDSIFVRHAWVEECTRTWIPFRIHVAAVGLRPKLDRLLLARSVELCGEAFPVGLKPFGSAMDTVRADWGFPAIHDCVEDPNAAAAPGERKLVCGDRQNGTVQVAEPGLYRICLCPRVPGYDCTHYSHYRLPAGDLFEVTGQHPAASGAWQDVISNSAAGGGAAQPPVILNGPGGAALVVEYAPTTVKGGSARLAVGSQDGVIRLWEPETPRLIAELVGHTAPVSSIVWAPDSSFLVSGSDDGTIRMWSNAAGVAPGNQPPHLCPRWEAVWTRPGGDATAQVLHDWTKDGGDATDQEWQHAINYHLGSAVIRWLNLTKQGVASQSSTRHGASAERAIDSILDARLHAGSCTHTETQTDPWWQVELGEPYAVRAVQVTNRADCCGDWLSPFFVYVDGVHGTTECAANVTIKQGETIEVPCVAIGHTVRIELHKTEVLTLCEVAIAYQTTEDVHASTDLRDILHLTHVQAARQCEKACTAYRERASPMCDCGPTFECGLVHNCVPKCGLEDHSWLPATNQRVTAVTLIPSVTVANGTTGTMIASASPDRAIYLFSIDHLNYGSELVTVIRRHQTAVVALAASATMPGILASAGDDLVVLWHDVASAISQVGQAVVQRLVDPLQGQSILALAFSSDGEWFAMAGNRSAVLWHIPTSTLLTTLEPAVSTSIESNGVAVGEIAAVAGLSFSFDSEWLALRLPTTVQLWPLSEVAKTYADQDPALGEWVTFTSEDLTRVMLRWTVHDGPYGNRPVYSGHLNEDHSELELRFAPCNISESNHSCAEELPFIRVDVEVPFEFTAVKGSFLEYSMGPNGADDCRGGTVHTSWEAQEAASHYWTLVATGERAEHQDCPRVGGGSNWHDDDVPTLASCKAECVANGFCNYINFRDHPPNCDLRRCLDPTHPVLDARRRRADDVGWAHVRREELEERLLPISDGYVMFGAPSIHGSGGVLYGGCQAGADIPTTGVTIEIPSTAVKPTRLLRWQVAQSRNTEKLGIRNVALQLWRPVAGRHSIAVSSSSAAVAFSPGRRELTVAVGDAADLAVWDLRGIDFPAATQEERLLKLPFGFELEAVGLLDLDRVRIVDAEAVPICGDTFSATNSQKVQGLGDGQRTFGTHNFSFWNMTIVTAAGNYRICFCGGRRTACCSQDADFAQQLMTFVVAGVENDHYDICEVQRGGGVFDCIIEGFRGIGLKDGDKIMVQDAPACGLATEPIPGLPDLGVFTARQPRVPFESKTYEKPGTWYRFEQPAGIYDVEYASWRMDASRITSPIGFTARLCWCALAAECDVTDPSDFRIYAGLLTVVRFEKLSFTTCYVGKECLVVLQLLPWNSPVAAGDLVMIMKGPQPVRRIADLDRPDVCNGEVVSGLGPRGDGVSARMRVDIDTRPEAIVEDPVGIFNMSIPSATPGTYRICWCQASFRPCHTRSEFVVDVGQIFVQEALYVWPTCIDKEPVFNGWRAWATFDDCCCNYYEAGAVGCLDEKTDAFSRCSQLPRR